ncbi:Ttll6 [Symbiodinium necroappetens]|uniref:Ttll6 protein n=1 Tax=Symbiodinium necroappetens TaxID=1628268 RepID=A0A812KI46_9DINO|nr:Ttll6 [Symbiodinium necroappetens]
MHLTNFSINYESDAFEDTEDGATGSKRSLRTVLDCCVADGQGVWTEIATCVRKTLLAIGPKMQENYHSYFGRTRQSFEEEPGCRSACFEILGFDFILDEDERLFLLEVNSAPSLSTPTALDEEIKSSMLGEAFRLLRMDGSAKVRHREKAQQRLADRQQEHVARREELARLREERLKCSVGFLSSLGQRKLPPIATSRHEPGEASTESQMPKTGGDKIDEGGTAEDSESSSDDSSSEEESDWEECDDEFCFLGTPVSRNYVQILPFAGMETDEWKEIQAGAAKLAQGWNINARRPQSQPVSEAQGTELTRSVYGLVRSPSSVAQQKQTCPRAGGKAGLASKNAAADAETLPIVVRSESRPAFCSMEAELSAEKSSVPVPKLEKHLRRRRSSILPAQRSSGYQAMKTPEPLKSARRRGPLSPDFITLRLEIALVPFILSGNQVADNLNDDPTTPYIYFEIPGDLSARGAAEESWVIFSPTPPLALVGRSSGFCTPLCRMVAARGYRLTSVARLPANFLGARTRSTGDSARIPRKARSLALRSICRPQHTSGSMRTQLNLQCRPAIRARPHWVLVSEVSVGGSDDRCTLCVHVADSVLGGRGLFASSTLSADSKVLSLPLEACLSSADPSVADLPVNSLFRLTELLCAEIQKGDASRWACWFRSLPRECGSWPEWREPELRAAQRGPPELFKEAVDLARKLPQWHKQLSQILPQSVIAGLDDKASFRRALAILFSRRFGMLCDDSKVAVCVPLGDMINHAATASVEVQYDQASRRLTFVTQDTVVAGDELLICYGQLDNLELCTSHGFVLPENPLDSIVLSDGVKLARTSQLQLPALAEVQQMMEDLPPKEEDEAVRTDTSNSQACRAIASFRLSYRQMLQQLLDGPAPG